MALTKITGKGAGNLDELGIGTSTVDSALHIEQNASGVTETSGSTLKIHNTNASGRSKISLHNNAETASGSIYYDTDSGMLALQGDTGAGVVIHTSGNNERLRVDTSGNVGIGGTPTELLYLQANNPEFTMQAASDGGECAIYFKDDDGNKDGRITYRTDYSGQTDNYMQFFTNGSERMRMTSGGNLFINTTNTSPNPGISISPSGGITQGNNDGTSGFYFLDMNRNTSRIGSITQSGTTGVAFNTSSDHRLKKNVADMTGAISRVKALAPKRFAWVADDDDRTVDGFLAHEAQAVVPEAVTGTKDEVNENGDAVMQGIDQSKLVPLLTGALKEAVAKIEALEARVAALEGS